MGKGGETIKSICAQSGAHCQVYLYRLYATCVSIWFFECALKDEDYDLECKAGILCGSVKYFVFFTQIRIMPNRILCHLRVESEEICLISYNIYEI